MIILLLFLVLLIGGAMTALFVLLLVFAALGDDPVEKNEYERLEEDLYGNPEAFRISHPYWYNPRTGQYSADDEEGL